MSNEIDEAQRRIETGWRVRFMEHYPVSIQWIVARYWKNGGLRTVHSYNPTSLHARAAYLAVTAPDQPSKGDPTPHHDL